MRADPRVTLLVVDPDDRMHWIEVRGTVRLLEEGALSHLDELAGRCAGARRYFGEVVPAELAEHEVPVIGCVTPLRVVTELGGDPPAPPIIPGEARRVAVDPKTRPRVTVPDTHRDLLTRPLTAALSTLMPDGHPQTQPVWCDFDGADVSVNTSRERQKGRNLETDPRATILVVDPDDPGRWVEVRGDVTITEEGGLDHLNRLTRAYTGHPHYYGWVLPLDRRGKESRIVCRIHPRHVVCDAIHR
jgi:PPOX class probable F420-dependent enzyme